MGEVGGRVLSPSSPSRDCSPSWVPAPCCHPLRVQGPWVATGNQRGICNPAGTLSLRSKQLDEWCPGRGGLSSAVWVYLNAQSPWTSTKWSELPKTWSEGAKAVLGSSGPASSEGELGDAPSQQARGIQGISLCLNLWSLALWPPPHHHFSQLFFPGRGLCEEGAFLPFVLKPLAPG